MNADVAEKEQTEPPDFHISMGGVPFAELKTIFVVPNVRQVFQGYMTIAKTIQNTRTQKRGTEVELFYFQNYKFLYYLL